MAGGSLRARRAEAEARAAEGAKVSDHLVLDLEPRAVPLRAAPGRGAATADLAGWLAKHAETREIPMLITWVQLANLADVAMALRAPRRVPFDPKRAEALQAAREFAEWLVERAAPIEIPGLVS
jgi:hypothetical protein